MKKILRLSVILGMLISLAACQLFHKNRESSVDARLSRAEPPRAPIPMAEGEPQRGFEQEPAGVPNP